MKRFLSATLALALLSGTAAYADPFGHGPRSGHHERWNGGYRHHRDDGAGAAVAVGFGLLALTAILASQDHERDRGPAYDNYPPPPPNGQDYRRGDEPNYDQGQTYDQGQGYGQDQGYDPDNGRPDDQNQPATDQRHPQGRQ